LPKPLFELANLIDYDIAPDGQGFVMVRAVRPGAAPRTLAVVLGWFDDVTRWMEAGRK
jgi:hypothetical protein